MRNRFIALILVSALIMTVFCGCTDEVIRTAVDEDGNIKYYSLDDACMAFEEEYDLTFVYDSPAAEFETKEAVYRMFLCKGEDTRLSVHAGKFIKTKDGMYILEPGFEEAHHQDVIEPIDGDRLKIIEIEIEDTDMKFVIGKAFWKRFKPYYNGEYYGRLDRNSMFFYAMKKDENVDIIYR